MLAAFGDEVMRREGARDRIARGGLFERLLVDDELLLRLDQVQQVVDAREDLGAVGGLGDEVVRSGRARALLGGVVLVARDHDHGHAADARVLGLRSEEHTSELQSPCNLVCRLLLEKKKIQLSEYRINMR